MKKGPAQAPSPNVCRSKAVSAAACPGAALLTPLLPFLTSDDAIAVDVEPVEPTQGRRRCLLQGEAPVAIDVHALEHAAAEALDAARGLTGDALLALAGAGSRPLLAACPVRLELGAAYDAVAVEVGTLEQAGR